MCRGVGIDPFDLNNMAVANLRGRELEDVLDQVRDFGPDAIIIDPIYKLYPVGHDENSAGDQAAILAVFDRLANDLETAIVYVHHDSKAGGGYMKAVVRGSGSGVTGRDFDAGLFLAPHANEEDSIVVEAVCRNYPSPDPFVARWTNTHFVYTPGVPAIPETPMTIRVKSRRGIGESDIAEVVEGWFIDGQPRGVNELYAQIMDDFTVGKDKARGAIKLLEGTRGFVHRKLHGNSGPYMVFPP
jgi:hypothetical protein